MAGGSKDDLVGRPALPPPRPPPGGSCDLGAGEGPLRDRANEEGPPSVARWWSEGLWLEGGPGAQEGHLHADSVPLVDSGESSCPR